MNKGQRSAEYPVGPVAWEKRVMVASVIGEGVCPGCGGPVKRRKGIVVKYCSIACAKNHRARLHRYSAQRWWWLKRARERDAEDGRR